MAFHKLLSKIQQCAVASAAPLCFSCDPTGHSPLLSGAQYCMPPYVVFTRVSRCYFPSMQRLNAMDKGHSRPLRTFVYRTLAIRLGAVTLALTLVVLAFTYFQQRDIFERQLADLLETELALL